MSRSTTPFSMRKWSNNLRARLLTHFTPHNANYLLHGGALISQLLVNMAKLDLIVDADLPSVISPPCVGCISTLFLTQNTKAVHRNTHTLVLWCFFGDHIPTTMCTIMRERRHSKPGPLRTCTWWRAIRFLGSVSAWLLAQVRLHPHRPAVCFHYFLYGGRPPHLHNHDWDTVAPEFLANSYVLNLSLLMCLWFICVYARCS